MQYVVLLLDWMHVEGVGQSQGGTVSPAWVKQRGDISSSLQISD